MIVLWAIFCLGVGVVVGVYLRSILLGLSTAMYLFQFILSQ